MNRSIIIVESVFFDIVQHLASLSISFFCGFRVSRHSAHDASPACLWCSIVNKYIYTGYHKTFYLFQLYVLSFVPTEFSKIMLAVKRRVNHN